MRDRAVLRRTVEQARAGDAQAMEQLCMEYLPRLRGFFRRLGAGMEADDLTQATLMRMMAHIGEFRPMPGSSFEGWLFRIAYNLFIDDRRRKVRRGETALEDYDAPDTGLTPEARLMQGENEESIAQALMMLDEESRAMVVMRYWREMSYIDIARALDISPVRVKWRLHDALRKLGRALKEEKI